MGDKLIISTPVIKPRVRARANTRATTKKVAATPDQVRETQLKNLAKGRAALLKKQKAAKKRAT